MAQAKKLVSFANPDLFKAAKSWTKDQIINVKTVKNDKTGYWDWVGLEGETVAESKPTASATRVTGSNYETKEERAARQVYIIRQSSLATAVDLLGQGASTDTVIETAKVFETYVLGNTGSFDDLPDDIPE